MLILALILFAGQGLWAQSQGNCGFVPTADMIQRTLANKAAAELAVNFREGETYVPIKFHLISKLDGSFRVEEHKVFDALCYLNEAYAEHGVQFYIYQGFDYINNSVAWEYPEDNLLLLNSRKEPRAMNIYIGNSANDDTSPNPGTTLAYYNPNYDWIICRRAEVNASSSTLAHEIGHFFSLLHTFNGWECSPWDASIHGSPVSSTVAPCASLEDGEPVDVELADGSNCDTSGDFLCDTPADYNFGLFDNNDCVYNYSCLDPNGDSMDPMENNFMSYFQNCSSYQFTAQQIGLVLADVASRTALETDFTPIAEEITELPILEYPVNGVEIAYNTVDFKWSASAGADRYILEYDINANFNLVPERILVWGTFKSVDGPFIQNKEYFWRVRPANSYFTCPVFSASGTFNTTDAVAVNEVTEVANWTIMPNPVAAGADLVVDVQASASFEGQLIVRALDGRAVYQMAASFENGANKTLIPTADMASGVYLISIVTTNGVVTERVIVGR